MHIKKHHSHKWGFTLVELAVVLLIIGLVSGGLIKLFDGPRSSAKYVEDQQKLANIKAAIKGYVARHRHMPCPDIDGDGLEDSETYHCQASEGFLPYNTLNTTENNAYGKRFYYVVSADADAPGLAPLNASTGSYFGRNKDDDPFDRPPYFNLSTPPTADVNNKGNGLIFVCGPDIADGNCDETTSVYEANDMIAAVISFGANSEYTWKGNEADYPTDAKPKCPSDLIAPEKLNCSDDSVGEINGVTEAQIYHNAQQTKEGFDDVITWVAAHELKTLLGMADDETPTYSKIIDFTSNFEFDDFLEGTDPVTGELNTGGLDGADGKDGWAEGTRAITINEEGDQEDVSVLTQPLDGQRVLFLKIPPSSREYIIHAVVELGSGNKGGYGVFFDTLIQGDELSENSEVEKGYVAQFNRGYPGAAENESTMLLRVWEEGANEETKPENAPENFPDDYRGAYARYDARPGEVDPEDPTNEDGGDNALGEDEGIPCKEAQTNECSGDQINDEVDPIDDAWWQDIHKITIKVTGLSLSRDQDASESTLDREVTVTVYDMVGYYGSNTWRERFSFSEDVVDFYYDQQLDPKDADGKLRPIYTGFRTWSSPQSYIYELKIQDID